jgi:succinate dehydrogenase / fumarate reductase membrane anchor subunit
MVEQVKIMRSQLGRARGLGAARAGTEHWIAERVSAVALVPLSVWFIVSLLSLLGAEQRDVAAWVRHPFNAAMLLALILATFHHAQLGMQVVFEDYVHGPQRRTAIVLAVKGAALLLGLLAALAVAKLYLSPDFVAAPGTPTAPSP